MFWYFGQSKKLLIALNSSKRSRGFSLLELTVVMTIFLIITAVVIADIPNFREKSSLDLTVSEVATYLRGAQVYSASQKGGEAGTVYGIHLDKDSSNFFLFKNDKEEPHEEDYEINGFKITKIAVIYDKPNNNNPFEMIDIVFQANDYTSSIGTQLEASIAENYNGGNLSDQFQYVEIKISSTRDNDSGSCIRIYHNGQITPAECSI